MPRRAIVVPFPGGLTACQPTLDWINLHSLAVFCLWAHHSPHSHRVYPIRKVGGVGGLLQDRGTFRKDSPPSDAARSAEGDVHSLCPCPCPAAATYRWRPYTMRYTGARRPTRGGGGGDNVRSHCISLCSLIIHPCRQRRCHICIQFRRRRRRRRRTCETRVRFVDISPACLF